MRSLLTNRISVKRNGVGIKPGTKEITNGSNTIYESLPARITDMKLYVMFTDTSGQPIRIQRNDIIEDQLTGFKYTILNHPQLGGGKAHHWECTLEMLINK
jgi:hypothetical protein